MIEVILQTYYILLPVVATGLVGWVGVILKSRNKKEKELDEYRRLKEKEQAVINEAMKNGMMMMIRYMLNRYHAEYVTQGKITYGQYKEWMDMFSVYTALGGNSIAVDWNEDVENLPKCNSTQELSVFEAIMNQLKKEKENESKGDSNHV